MDLNLPSNTMDLNPSQQISQASTASASQDIPSQLDKVPDNKKKRKITSPVNSDTPNYSEIHRSEMSYAVPTSNRFT